MSALKDEIVIVNAFLKNDRILIKQAGVLEDFASSIKNVFNNHFDPNDNVGSVINFLAPGVVGVILGTLGFRWLGILLGLAMNVFHVDIASILGSISSRLRGVLTADKKLTESEVEGIVQQSLSSGTIVTSYDRLMLNKLESLSVDQRIKEYSLIKEGGANAGKFLSLLGTILNVLVKTVLTSAGLLVAGDAINYGLGRPSGLTQKVYPSALGNSPSVTSSSSQKTFKLKSSYVDTTQPVPWLINATNTKEGIKRMLANMAKEVYEGLDNLDSLILSSTLLDKLASIIYTYSQRSDLEEVVVMPKALTSKKEVVDYFIDEVAAKYKK